MSLTPLIYNKETPLQRATTGPLVGHYEALMFHEDNAYPYVFKIEPPPLHFVSNYERGRREIPLAPPPGYYQLMHIEGRVRYYEFLYESAFGPDFQERTHW